MTSDELASIIGAMTERPWELDMPFVDAGGGSIAEFWGDRFRSDLRAVVALANHASAFLELVRACERLRDHTVPQYVAVCDVLSALHEVHAVGKEGA